MRLNYAKNRLKWLLGVYVGIEYHCVPDLMFYGSVSKGYRSGGFNMFAMDSRYYSYEPESLWNYEVGVKGDFFDHRLVVNGALYYMDISDMATATTRYTMIREKSAYR
ncbi:TonB-dependent receptor domain-containing protein [uncultured Desulfobacter sp.]|uniref:TonB-dependent receptor domain-containing protein n=1 Tax=uncultured Desulfobacter sp. TaxID=240139 RepID=UPI002D1E4552|nr:TonB-dependent receptor [uncultured Desulfobacter sp.]